MHTIRVPTKNVQIIRPIAEYSVNLRILRVAAYCRVSTDSNDQLNSFLNQVRYYTDFICTSEKMELVDIYADEGISGTSINKRDEFNRMMNDARLGKIDRIYVKSIQRFARNSLECLESIRKLSEYGVSVIFENDHIDTRNMSSEMIVYIKSAFAQNESMSYSKRMATAYRMKMEDGNFITYHAPYGYRLENGSLVIVPNEAEIIKRIFNMYLSGSGCGQIAAALNRENVPSNGGAWTSVRIQYIISNEKYIGDSMLQKTFTPDILPLRNKPNKGERDKFYVQNSHPAILDRQTFQLAQERKEARSQKEKKGTEEYIFTKKIVCNECGWAYKRRVQNNTVYWICSHKGNSGFECGGKNISENNIFSSFICMYNRLKQNEKLLVDDTLSLLTAIRTKLISQSAEVTEIDSEIAKLCKQNDMYVQLRNKKIMDEVSFMEQSAELQSRLTTLRNRRIKLMSEDENLHYIEELRMLKDVLQDAPRVLLEFDVELFNSIVDKIFAGNDGTITFVLKGGLKFKERVKL